MKKTSLILLLLFFYCYCTAQHLEYTYDLAGNRIHRKYIVPRLANPTKADSSTIMKYGISVYPNPAPDKINVSITYLDDGETAKIYLSDEQGKVLLMRDQTSKLEALDLSNLKAGIYYIKVYVKQESVSYKIVKL